MRHAFSQFLQTLFPRPANGDIKPPFRHSGLQASGKNPLTTLVKDFRLCAPFFRGNKCHVDNYEIGPYQAAQAGLPFGACQRFCFTGQVQHGQLGHVTHRQ